MKSLCKLNKIFTKIKYEKGGDCWVRSRISTTGVMRCGRDLISLPRFVCTLDAYGKALALAGWLAVAHGPEHSDEGNAHADKYQPTKLSAIRSHHAEH